MYSRPCVPVSGVSAACRRRASGACSTTARSPASFAVNPCVQSAGWLRVGWAPPFDRREGALWIL